MRNIFPIVFFLCFSITLISQPNFTANDQVPTLETPFRLSVNPNFNGHQWSDQKVADIAAGNPDVGVPGVGVTSFRVPLPENFLDYWGYDIRTDAFHHYDEVGLYDNTVFLEAPAEHHRDTTMHCPTSPSVVFANIYEPIWDDGTDGTPVNEDNYFALYVYKTVSLYKDQTRFWEIWNEPDLDSSGDGWKPRDIDGNWYDNTPQPCDIQLRAPVFYYIRLLRISYEVIKTLDPDAYITTGGIGYESFLDVILRYTDNPDGGTVTPEYPLKGGAYFDVLSYHVYPHINGSLREWDNSINGFVYSRHSDAALDGVMQMKDNFVDILFEYGYNGITYPKKLFIITETTVPNKQLENYIGSYESSRNYMMKLQIAAQENEIRQIAIYQLADQNSFVNGSSWLEMCGMYKIISGVDPYDVTPNEAGIGSRTTTDLLDGKSYDADLTNQLNLPDNIRGGAFVSASNPSDTLFVLWAKTETDQSEEASAIYSFPDEFNFSGVERKKWNYADTENATNISHKNIQLDGAPVFLKGIFGDDPTITSEIDLTKTALIQPNPFYDFIKITFELKEDSNVELLLYDARGIIVYEWSQENMVNGVNTILIEDTDLLASSTYFGQINMDNQRSISFKVLKMKL